MNRRQLFVGAVASLLAKTANATAPVSFYVHRNGASQALYTTQYNRIMFTSANLDDGNNFNFTQARWVAPADGRLLLTGAAYCAGGLRLDNNANWTIKFIRNSSAGNVPPNVPNGGDIFAVVGGPLWPNTNGIGIVVGNGVTSVAAGDAIEMAVYNVSASGGHTVTLDGNPAHTFMSGMFWAS